MWIKTAVVLGTILLILENNANQAQRVARIGSEIKHSASGVDAANVTFLLDTDVSNDGVIFAFAAYFRTYSAVRLQIWRPVGNENETLFELISQVRVIPAGIFQRENVYIESKISEKCTRVYRGDRLGLYVEEAPGSIVYTFVGKNANTLRAHHPIEANATYDTGIRMLFDKLTFPYEFSLAAYIDMDLSKYNDSNELHPKCPRGLLIPEYGVLPVVTTGVPKVVTGEPGYTGATGPVGEKGKQGDRGLMGGIGSTGATGPIGDPGLRGFKGDAGKDGANGQTGAPGATGYVGPMGKNGLRGFPGSPGPMGPPGEVNIVTVSPKTLELKNRKDESLLDPSVILGILIWLVIVTILILVILVVLLWLLYKQKKNEKEMEREKKTSLKNNSFLTDASVYLGSNNNNKEEEAWIQKMKEETESHYKLDTIEDPKRRKSGLDGERQNNVTGRIRGDGGSEYRLSDLYGENNDLSHRNSLSKNNDRYNVSGQPMGAINTIYKNLDVPQYEVKNY